MHMMLTAQDSSPAALTLWPVSRVTRKHWGAWVTILLITPKNLMTVSVCQGTRVTLKASQEQSNVCVRKTERAGEG